jgi:glycosyltransferase involved in cell wall biosynthesis
LRIALVTDAWQPQINGVVRTWQSIISQVNLRGHTVRVVHPLLFRTVPCPGYPSIPLAIRPGGKMKRLLGEIDPQAVHIATEGPLGLAARDWCCKRKLPFTTSYHTQFPEYLRMYFGLPPAPTYALMRWFHNRGSATLVPTESVQKQLQARRFAKVVLWPRGVDCDLFHPARRIKLDFPRPIMLYCGRVAREKGIDHMCRLEVPGTKLIVGDGPDMRRLKRKFPDAHFTGAMVGADLAGHYAAADVLVFPSRTDTFGNAMLEAMACGTPVAAYPVTGPVDLIQQHVTGVMHEDLNVAVREALQLDGLACHRYALGRSWPAAANIFLENLQVFEAAGV